MNKKEIGVAEILSKNGIVILATDTLYGIVGSAFSLSAVDRIFTLKQRAQNKPLIVLIESISELEKFGVTLSKNLISKLNQYWPGPFSISLDVTDDKFKYLHRDTNQIAFRIPDQPKLVEMLKKSGPLVAPSANTEGMPPAKTIAEAKNYFGDGVDFYLDDGLIEGNASTLIRLDGDEVIVIRK